MASKKKKKHSEGIALLSVYSDEDDEDMEDAEEEEQRNQRIDKDDHLEESNAMDNGASTAPRSHETDSPVNFGADGESTDTLLNQFLPPPPRDKCSEELQRKIDKFLNLKKSFNNEVRNRKEYRNPDFLLHAVSLTRLVLACFSKRVFDPNGNGYDSSDFCDALERERKEQESKKNQVLDFFSAGAQPRTVFAAQKPNIPIPGVPASASTGLPCVPTEIAARDGRPNKISKWDKVDGDVKNPPPLVVGTQDSLFSIQSSAALASGATAGSGYSAYANQQRREVEGRSAEWKLERRS